MSSSVESEPLSGICIVGQRQSGRTTQLIGLSEETGTPIIVPHAAMRDCIENMAELGGYDIPEPLVFNPACTLRGARSGDGLQPVLVDELQMFFARSGMRPVAVTLPFSAAEFVFDEDEIKQATPSLFQVLRMWWRCRKAARRERW